MSRSSATLARATGSWLALHLLAVIPALPLGAFVLLGRKGDAQHKLLGRTWGGLMMLAALSSFGLRGLTGGFSPIHLLSILTLVMIPRAIVQVRRGDIAGHRRTMSLTHLGLALPSACERCRPPIVQIGSKKTSFGLSVRPVNYFHCRNEISITKSP